MSAPHRLAYRPTVMSTRGVVAAAHPVAAMAGIQVMLQGGSAVDAACATSFALHVVEPYMSAPGGVASILVSRRGTPETLLSAGQVPAGADPSGISEADLQGGARSIGIPGLPAAIFALHERYGSVPRSTALAPAIRLAEEGFPLTWRNCEFFAKGRAQLAYSPEAERTFLAAGGRVPRPGTVLVQKELGGSLRQLAEGGADAFYRGPLARAMARAVQEHGGWLTEADLAGYGSPTWGSPITARFRDHDVYVPTYSFAIPQTLQILEGFDLRGFGHNSVDYLHHLIEAVKLASADRVAWGARPDLPMAGLLAPAYAASRRTLIDPARAGVSGGERWTAERLPGEILPGHPADFMKEHTTHFATADSDGTVVSVTQTLGSPFGSGIMAPGTGLMLNNMLFWTELDPASANALRPGVRLQTRMSPCQAFRGGRFRLSIGTPGSFGILQTTPQMLLNVLEFGMAVQEAIEAPRVRAYRDRLVDVEGRVPAETREALAARGHQVNVLEDWSWVVGGGQGIERDPESGALAAGADPRRDGYAVGI
jgi:gamma-glutamyltranspeptidase/glutathione hydrolase